MNKKSTILTAALALLAFLALPIGVWGQSDYSTDYTGNVTLSATGGTSASACKVVINNTQYDGIKAGLGSAFGAMKITVPADTKYLHLHVAAWNGNNNTSLSVTPSGYSENIALTSNSGIAGNSPFTFSGDPSTSSYYKVITFSNALTEATELTFTATGGTRFVIWGVTSEEAGGGSNPEIQIAADELQLPWTANSGGYFNVTYTNDFEPYTAYAKLYNDAQGEEEFDGDWIELIEEDLSDPSLIEYAVQANTGTSVRTVYLYVEAMDESTNVIDAMFTITQAAQPTYTVTYAPNGGSGTMTDPDSPYHAGDVVALLANTFTAPEDMIWDSWQVKDADNNDVTVSEGSFIMPASNVTVTAQWETDPSGPQYEWVLTPLADLTEDDIFVIVGTRTDDTYGGNYAMTNNGGTTNAPDAFAVTIANERLSSAPADNLKWKISGNANDGYTFYPNGTTATWLYCTNTNNGVRVGTNTKKTFTINSGYLYHYGTSRHVGIYNNLDWRCYSPQSGNVHNNIANQTFAFYKKVTSDPYITATNPETLDYNAISGSFTFTLNNPVEGGSLNVEENEEWISEATIDGNASNGYSVSFTTTANAVNAQRQGTITLTYTYGTPAQTITKEVIITQAAAPVVYDNIPMLFAAATSTETPVTITFDNWVISAVKGNNAYLTDNAGNGLIIYQSGHGFSVNDVLSGTVSCNLLLYYGSAELKGLTSTTEGLTVTDGGTVDEINSIGINMLGGVNTGALLAYTNLTYDGTALVDADNNAITPYSTFYSGTFENGKKYNVKGIFLQYNTTKEILPRSADDIEEVVSDVPFITVDPNPVQISGDAGSGSLTVTYNKVYADIDLVEFIWCNADGSTPATENYENWLSINFDSEDATVLYYMVGDNEEDHTAYFKILGLAEDTYEEVYSDVVTFTQIGLEVDYAYLPYEFNGGRADIENEKGLTQNGLGTDYSGNNPKLKFDHTGDNLVLKINPNPYYQYAPLAITFDIKGNSFSAGTFSVQVSEDGVNYDDLAVYTEAIITGSAQTFTLLNTNDNVRYIRWYFTEKGTGNIGLGNLYVDDTYEIRGTATITDNLTLDVCNININGVLNIEGSLEVTTSLSNEGYASNLIIKDGAQLKTPNAVYATVEKTILGYGEDNSQTNKGYYLVSAPAEKYLYVAQDNDDVDAYRFDASQEGEEWQNFKLAAGAWHVSASSGVLYASKNTSTLSLDGYGIVYNNQGATPVNNKVPATITDVAVDIRFNSGKAFEGYNLIGNPFTCNAYLADGRDFYRMNTTGDGFITASGAINVSEGIFVVAESTNDNSVTFTTTNPTGAKGMINLDLTPTRGSVVDNARIRFGEGSNLPKFVFSENSTRLYIPQGDKEYAVVRSEAQGEMPVCFKAAANGSYTLNVDVENLDVNYLHLIDNMTGADIDLLATPSYTFEASTSDYASRFRLVFSTTNVSENAESDSFAYFNGSEWMISIDGNATLEVIDMTGRVLSSETISGTANTRIAASAGVYMLRLVTDNGVMTQKIVVK